MDRYEMIQAFGNATATYKVASKCTLKVRQELTMWASDARVSFKPPTDLVGKKSVHLGLLKRTSCGAHHPSGRESGLKKHNILGNSREVLRVGEEVVPSCDHQPIS